MHRIFIGMIWVFINFNLDIGDMRIGLIPNFVGYYFMLKGLSEIMEFSSRFSKIMPFVKGMIVYSVITYVIDLFGGSLEIEYVNTPVGLLFISMGIISTLLSIFISYNIIMGIKDIEIIKQRDLNTNQLYSIWKLLVTFSIITHFFVFTHAMLAIVSILVGFVIQIVYLFAFWKTKNLYYNTNSS